jgi:hypothetical protein
VQTAPFRAAGLCGFVVGRAPPRLHPTSRETLERRRAWSTASCTVVTDSSCRNDLSPHGLRRQNSWRESLRAHNQKIDALDGLWRSFRSKGTLAAFTATIAGAAERQPRAALPCPHPSHARCLLAGQAAGRRRTTRPSQSATLQRSTETRLVWTQAANPADARVGRVVSRSGL